YVPEPQHPEYHAPSDDDIQVEDDDEDPEEDPNEEHESKGSEETEPFKEDEIAITPPPPRHRRARISVRPQTPMAASTQESENFYTQLLDAQTDSRDIRLKIDVVRGQRTAYETELQEVHQAYLSFKAQNRELLARLETLKTYLSRTEWQRQSAEDLAVTQMMRTNNAMTPESIQAMIDWAIQRNSTHTQDDASQSSELALMCTKFLADETEKIDKYISGLPDNIHGNVMSVRPKTLDETIELANDLMDQKLRTYAER
nr:hypothetical protein [Tanacetum cinerariifolium]